ncbi:MAG: hypothetical protein ACR2GD_02310 [Pyrinomonadaceae bacterium]
MKTARIFQILAVILVGVAAYFLWLGNKDGAFVALVLSGCAYFLNLRFQIKESLKNRTEAEIKEKE